MEEEKDGQVRDVGEEDRSFDLEDQWQEHLIEVQDERRDARRGCPLSQLDSEFNDRPDPASLDSVSDSHGGKQEE